jgi:hypothetical protein
MYELYTLLLLIVVSLVLSILSKDIRNIGFTVLLSSYFFLIWSKNFILSELAMIILWLVCISVSIYAYIHKTYSWSEKLLIISAAFLLLIRIMARFWHENHIADYARLLCIIPTILYLILIFGKNKNRIMMTGFTTLLVGSCLLQFIYIMRLWYFHGVHLYI